MASRNRIAKEPEFRPYGTEHRYCSSSAPDYGIADAAEDTNELALRDLKHYRETGHHLGLFGSRRHMNEIFGCFIATAVYGSYDCPEVLTLRAFRDNVLKKYRAGRAFIAIYYRYGPYLARIVKGSPFLSSAFKRLLDRIVSTLRARGIDKP